VADIVTDVSDGSLLRAIQASACETWKVLSAAPQVQVHDEGGLLWVATGIRHPAFNAVLRAEAEPSRADGMIAETLDFFRRRELPFTWWTWPDTTPEDLGERLRERGLSSEAPLTGAAGDLAGLNWIGGSPAGLTLEWVEDAETYRTYQDVLTRSAQTRASAAEAMCMIMSSVAAMGEMPLMHYLGRIEGKPMATAMLSLAGGVAGVYQVGALPEAHADGIEAAMALAALLDARDMDFRLAVMQTSRLAFNTFSHLGLEERCEIGQYVWTPPEPPIERSGQPLA
jgi:hypothetical protein